MRWKIPLIGLIGIMLATPAPAQTPDAREGAAPPRATEIPTEGFWPTRKMMDRIIDRIVDQMAGHYQLDEEQARLTGDLFKDRYPAFLNANRAELQTLANEYFEALMNDEPPAPEEVAVWAARAQPLLAELGDLTHEVMGSMHEILNDDQAVTLDAELAAFDTGLQMAQNKLSSWADGNYDPETEWIRPPKNRRDPNDGEHVGPPTEAVQDEAGSTPAAASLPVDEWAIHTQRFIERYQLNPEQKQKAYQILRRQQEARDKYLRRKVEEMARVTRQLSEAATEEARQAALRAYEELNAPVAQLFQTLKERLLSLPTRAQRKAAEEAGLTEEDRLVAPSAEAAEQPAEPSAEQPVATSQAAPSEP